ncbi:MAG: TetR family transcriptional regulator [Acidobacteria bacterium]|nr:TetR family transcriptional regulator [Acidobacteriota bacterium]
MAGSMAFDPDSTQTSRARLLEAGKRLFARLGYEQASTSAIAREAGTSESQLVRYYRGKAGLLEAIFNESWQPLNQQVQHVVAGATDSHEALLGVLATLTAALGNDHDLAFLLLFEGRRIRSGSTEIFLSQGFVDFTNLIRLLINRGKRDGTFRATLSDSALVSALTGAAEAMIRDRLVAERAGKPNPFNEDEVREVFDALLGGVAPARRARATT